MAQINWGLLDRDAPLKAGMAPMQGYQGAVRNAMATQVGKQKLAQNQMALKQAQQGMDDKNAMRDIYSQGGDISGNLQAGGFGKEAMQYGAQDTQNRVGLLQEKKLNIEDALTKFKVIGQLQSTVTDQASYDLAKQEIANLLGPEAAANIPQVYNPAEIEANKQKAFTLQEQLFNQYKETSMQLAQEKNEFMKNKPTSTGTPYFTPVQTGQGIMSFDARTGLASPLDVGGRPVIGSTSDPSLQGLLASSKASGKAMGKSKTEAMIDLPRIVDTGNESIKLLDDLLAHPGLSQSVGKSRMAGVQKVPGTDAFDFETRLEQLQGKQFLQAFQSLKGGGQITEIEGKKATQAMSRMNASSSEPAFREAVLEFKGIVQKGLDRAKKKAEGGDLPQVIPQTQTINTQEEYDALQSGEEYIDPDDGQLYRKP